MRSVYVHEAKTHFSKLLEQVQQGEEIVIAKAGQPIAKLTPYTPAKRTIAPPGSMEGEAWMAPTLMNRSTVYSRVWLLVTWYSITR